VSIGVVGEVNNARENGSSLKPTTCELRNISELIRSCERSARRCGPRLLKIESGWGRKVSFLDRNRVIGTVVRRRNRLSKPDVEAARKSLSFSNKTYFSSSACYAAFDTIDHRKKTNMFVKGHGKEFDSSKWWAYCSEFWFCCRRWNVMLISDHTNYVVTELDKFALWQTKKKTENQNNNLSV